MSDNSIRTISVNQRSHVHWLMGHPKLNIETMADFIQDIVPAGTPILKSRSEEVPVDIIQTPQVQNFIDLLITTMKHYHGAGLAAPQVGKSWRILCYGFEKNPRYPEAPPIPLSVLINPIILDHSLEANLTFEACLSISTLRGEVPRYNWLDIKAFDRQGIEITKRVHGFEARIIQHEIDHLDGVFFIERIQNFRYFGFTEVLKEQGIIK